MSISYCLFHHESWLISPHTVPSSPWRRTVLVVDTIPSPFLVVPLTPAPGGEGWDFREGEPAAWLASDPWSCAPSHHQSPCPHTASSLRPTRSQ